MPVIPPKPHTQSAVLALRVQALESKVKPLEHKVKVLERKSRGITRSNAEVARLKAELANIKFAIEAINTTGGDRAILAAGERDAEAINGRLDELFTEVNKKVNALSVRVDKNTVDIAANTADIARHDTTLNRHDSEIHMLAGGQRSLSGRIDEHRTIITRLENGGSASFPVVKAVIAVVIGIIAALWWESVSFAGAIPIPFSDQPVPFEYAFANNGWTAVLCGFGVAAIVFGVLGLIPSRQRTETTETRTRTEQHDDNEPQPSWLQQRWQQRRRRQREEQERENNRVHNDNHTPATDPTPATTVQPAVAGDGNRS